MLRNKSILYFLLFTTGYLLLVFIFNHLLNFGVIHSDNLQTGKVNILMNHSIDPEFILFGSSVAEVGFDPGLFQKSTGLTAFNMAIDGTPLRQYASLVDEFIGYTKNCRYVAVGLSFFCLSEVKGSLTEPGRFMARLNNHHIKSMFLENDPDLTWRLSCIPGYRFTQYKHTYYKNALIGYRNLFSNKVTVIPNFGYTPRYDSWNPAEDIPVSIYATVKILINDSLIEKVNGLFGRVREKGIKLVFIRYPMYQGGQKLFSNYGLMSEVIKDKMVKEGDIFLDFSDNEICNDKDNFYNNGHLNDRGTSKLTKYLAEVIGLKNCLRTVGQTQPGGDDLPRRTDLQTIGILRRKGLRGVY